jgi:general secretion pathway protein G
LISSRRGFTLLELMLVIMVLGVIAAITMPRLAGRSKQAAIAAARTDIDGTIAVALDLYELDNGGYPTSDQGLAALYEQPRSGSAANNWNGPYIKRQVGSDPWGNPYEYRSPGTHHAQDYDLWSLGPDEADGTDDDITNW